MKKRLFLLLAIFTLSLVTVNSAGSIPIEVIVNSNTVQFDVPPIIENGRTLVPVRAIFEALGAKVEWDPDTKTVTGLKGNKTVIIKIDSKTATVNGINKTLDVPATIRQGRTLVPLRFISEGLGSIVSWDGKTRTATINNGLKASFIDVGQADSILIETPNGKAMLIDAGNNQDGDTVTSFIRNQGLNKIDVIIGTHPHEDHIGGMDEVIKNFDVGKIYMPRVETTTKSFEDLLLEIKNKELKINTAKLGENIDLDPELNIDVLAPISDKYESLNNYSVVIKISYKNNSFLLTGDAEDLVEEEMLMANVGLKADVLKVGHHGSNTSTTDEFLKAVNPKHAIISVGKDNNYGHPSKTTIAKLLESKIHVYRTDEDGTIVAFSDGNTIAFDKITPSITPVKVTPSVIPSPSVTPMPVPSNSQIDVIISNIDLEGEVATITNKSTFDVSMTGWKLVSVKGNQSYNFPDGFTLKVGASVKITSGKSAYNDGSSVLKWTTTNIWNNDGDPAELYDNIGKLISSK